MFAVLPASLAGTITNVPPVAANDGVQRNEDSRLRVRAARLLANDTDPANGRLTLSSVSAKSAAGGTVVRRAKWILYTPPPGFTNSDSFTYVIANTSGLKATASVKITIRADIDPSQNVAASEVLANGNARIQFIGIPGRNYRIQYTDSLTTPRWRPLGKRLADATGQFELIDPVSPRVAGRTYRSVYP